MVGVQFQVPSCRKTFSEIFLDPSPYPIEQRELVLSDRTSGGWINEEAMPISRFDLSVNGVRRRQDDRQR
jgi:hypothetical protein